MQLRDFEGDLESEFEREKMRRNLREIEAKMPKTNRMKRILNYLLETSHNFRCSDRFCG
jgi:hypothetical protein